jgi:hypothetical protein
MVQNIGDGSYRKRYFVIQKKVNGVAVTESPFPLTLDILAAFTGQPVLTQEQFGLLTDSQYQTRLTAFYGYVAATYPQTGFTTSLGASLETTGEDLLLCPADASPGMVTVTASWTASCNAELSFGDPVTASATASAYSYEEALATAEAQAQAQAESELTCTPKAVYWVSPPRRVVGDDSLTYMEYDIHRDKSEGQVRLSAIWFEETTAGSEEYVFTVGGEITFLAEPSITQMIHRRRDFNPDRKKGSSLGPSVNDPGFSLKNRIREDAQYPNYILED